MNIKQKIREADESIERGYLDIVTNNYRPLFKETQEKAVQHMEIEGIDRIELSVPHLELRQDGELYQANKKIELRSLPKIYQDRSDSVAAQADDRHRQTPDIHIAMRNAFSDLRSCVRNSLINTI